MDGRDGGGIEPGQRITEAGLARREFLGRAVQQLRDNLVLPHQGGIVEGRDRVGDLATNPITQFLGGGAAEGDEQHLIQGCRALGDIAGHQTGQGEGLAGSGAGLQHGRGARRRKRAEQIEAARFH